MTRFVFLDLDDTILDFHRTERAALTKALLECGILPTEAVLSRYHQIDRQHWQRLERGELTHTQVQEGRFRVLLTELGAALDPAEVNRRFRENLCGEQYFLPQAREAVERLRQNHRLFLASNGTAAVQHARLTGAGLYPYFEQVFISEEIGFNKPSREFFDACFARIPGFDKSSAIMVGDSLTSDILGGLRAGLRTCWLNPARLPPDPAIRPDCEIRSLAQLEALL